MAIVTGSNDALECAFRKFGIDDTEFSNPSFGGGLGRVNLFTGAGSPGASYSPATPPETVLWGTQAQINAYDMVLFGCQGNPYAKTAAQQQILINYANAGGRIFTDHYGYVWLWNDTPFSTTATWNPNQTPNFSVDPETGIVNQSFAGGAALAGWLQFIGASVTFGAIPIGNLRNDFTAVIPPANTWLYVNDPNYPFQKPMHFTFNAPVGAPPANQCGRVLFEDYHVETATVAPGTLFPTECTTPTMSAQEKLLEFSVFDLGSCVTPITCQPKTCSDLGANCGLAGDGCGNPIQCGTCPANQACVGGICATQCTPKDCAAQGFMCGVQSDGCGNVQNCGACVTGETCVAGQCSASSCTPLTCGGQGFNCGQQGDGCGGMISCGTCVPGQVCNGGVCRGVACSPLTCTQQGFNCGQATDTCGNAINCGVCPPGQTCGVGGPNRCGGNG
jgi:hypothetical protein